MRSKHSWIGLGRLALAVAVAVVAVGASCPGSSPTDCYEMRTASGIDVNGDACTCTFYFASTDGTASGPTCHEECRNELGQVISFCSATP